MTRNHINITMCFFNVIIVLSCVFMSIEAESLIKTKWIQEVNQKNQIDGALSSNADIVEADVNMVSDKIVMGQPNETLYTITLKEVLDKWIARGANKRLMLDFHVDDIFESALDIISKSLSAIPNAKHKNLWINAICEDGPGMDQMYDILAETFLMGITAKIPYVTISLGWATKDPKSIDDKIGYDDLQLLVGRVIQMLNLEFNVNYMLRASLAANSLEDLKRIVKEGFEKVYRPITIVLWCKNQAEKINYDKLAVVVKEIGKLIGKENVLFDLPQSMFDKLNQKYKLL